MPHLPRLLFVVFLALSAMPLAATECSDNTVEKRSVGCGGESNGQRALFQYDGRSYLFDDLRPSERQSWYELELKQFEARKLILDNALWQIHIDQEAARRNIDRDKLALELLRIEQPSEESLKTFYQANKAQISAPYEEIKSQLASYLIQQQVIRNRASLIDALRQQQRYQVLLDMPQPPIAMIDTQDYPSRGSEFAPVEVVEFADYQCPHCKTASQAMARLRERFGEKLRVVFMDFPINRSGISTRVAEGAVCADRQGHYWAYHEAAFALQSSLSLKSPEQLAERIGLDKADFAACIADGSTAEKIAKSKAEGLRLGIDSTPAFFVNGRRVTIREDFEKELAEAISLALKE
ncbi:MAG: DsbA family protein [Gammaproteobacteria bacterium]|nr:DsbA family protein [Gammaproteobacteria bacterium]